MSPMNGHWGAYCTTFQHSVGKPCALWWALGVSSSSAGSTIRAEALDGSWVGPATQPLCSVHTFRDFFTRLRRQPSDGRWGHARSCRRRHRTDRGPCSRTAALMWLGSPSTCLSLDGSAPSGGSGSYQGHARDPDGPTVISGFLSSH